jgi:hypothetical protein
VNRANACTRDLKKPSDPRPISFSLRDRALYPTESFLLDRNDNVIHALVFGGPILETASGLDAVEQRLVDDRKHPKLDVFYDRFFERLRFWYEHR